MSATCLFTFAGPLFIHAELFITNKMEHPSSLADSLMDFSITPLQCDAHCLAAEIIHHAGVIG
jgi:hypothetical protein